MSFFDVLSTFLAKVYSVEITVNESFFAHVAENGNISREPIFFEITVENFVEYFYTLLIEGI